MISSGGQGRPARPCSPGVDTPATTSLPANGDRSHWSDFKKIDLVRARVHSGQTGAIGQFSSASCVVILKGRREADSGSLPRLRGVRLGLVGLRVGVGRRVPGLRRARLLRLLIFVRHVHASQIRRHGSSLAHAANTTHSLHASNHRDIRG